MAVERVPSEVPGYGRRFWQATNEQARQWGGNLTLSAEGERRLVLAFSNGVTLHTERLGACDGAAQTGAESLSTLLGAPADVPVQMYRVIDERLSESATFGGLCGQLATTTVAATEFVDEQSGEWVLRAASFQGPFDIAKAPSDLKICFALDYAPAL